MAGPRQETTMSAGTGASPGQVPPDLPSLLLDARICYIGMPVCSLLLPLPKVVRLGTVEFLSPVVATSSKPGDQLSQGLQVEVGSWGRMTEHAAAIDLRLSDRIYPMKRPQNGPTSYAL
jgi:hypothetical protein